MYLFNKFFAFVLITITALSLTAPSVSAQDAKVIKMEGTDKLKFTKTDVTAKPGQKITVKLTTVSNLPPQAMSHNFVLLKAGVDATKVAQSSAKFADNEYIAREMKDKIITYTGMAGAGETVEVTFTAPEEPGEYTYVCTFPGHYLGGMEGTLTVK